MVHILSGKIDAGKTTTLRKLFVSHQDADGFVALKVFENGVRVGYDLEDLRTGERVPLARIEPVPSDWLVAAELGPFFFSTRGFEAAEAIVERGLRDPDRALFMDEVGKLELRGEGLHDLVQRVLAAQVDCYLAVRDTNVKAVAELFAIREYKLLSV